MPPIAAELTGMWPDVSAMRETDKIRHTVKFIGPRTDAERRIESRTRVLELAQKELDDLAWESEDRYQSSAYLAKQQLEVAIRELRQQSYALSEVRWGAAEAAYNRARAEALGLELGDRDPAAVTPDRLRDDIVARAMGSAA